MAWVKLDDHFTEHPKFANVGGLGVALYVAGLAYCNRNLTDGRIPRGFVGRLVDLEDRSPGEVAGRLVAAGLWDETDDGYEVHDYLEHQRSAAEIRSLSVKRAAAGLRGAEATNGKRSANGRQVAEQTVGKPSAEVEVDLEEERDVCKRVADVQEDPTAADAADTPAVNGKRRRATGQSRLPPDWVLTPELVAYATARGMSRARVDVEADKFRDYFWSKGARYLDWGLVWQRWVRTATAEHPATGRPINLPAPPMRLD